MSDKQSYYEANREKIKNASLEYYKENKILIKNGVSKKKNKDLYDWYVEDKKNAVFKIRHGSFSYHEDNSKYFK